MNIYFLINGEKKWYSKCMCLCADQLTNLATRIYVSDIEYVLYNIYIIS